MSEHAVGVEERDVDVKAVMWFVIWLAVGIVAVSLISWWLFTSYLSAQIASVRPTSLWKDEASKQLAPIIRLEGIEENPVPQVNPNQLLLDQAMRKWLAQYKGEKKPTPPEFLQLPTDATAGRSATGGVP